MKRLVILATCLAMLTLTGCANGLLGGGMFCNERPALFRDGGLLSDGPIRQFLRGDQCDTCNAHAGQMLPTGNATCNACGNAVSSDPYAMPATIAPAQPVTSFYPETGGVTLDGGVMLDQPLLPDSGLMAPVSPGLGQLPAFNSQDQILTEPPMGGMN
jgi:hypothetical protein